MQIILAAIFSLAFHFSTAVNAVSWEGNWSFKDNNARYFTLTVGERTDNNYACVLEVEGKGFVYKLNCTGVERAGSLELRYAGVAQGTPRETFRQSEVLFTLKQTNNKVVTNWNKWNTANGTEQFKKS